MATKTAKQVGEKLPKGVTLLDEKLAGHLKIAEEHLIEAVKIFNLNSQPKRTRDYITRLIRAQEMVTALFREELIRLRGPIKITVVAGKRKK